MSFPFSLESQSDWLNLVPQYLLEMSDDSEYVYNENFHQYLGKKLVEYFPQAPSEFIEVIKSILTYASEAGKYVLLATLLQTEEIWHMLAQDVKLQPLLTELALSPDRTYAKFAVELSKLLEEIQTKPKKKIIEEIKREKDEALSLRSIATSDMIDAEIEELISEDLPKKKILEPSKLIEKEIEEKPPISPESVAPPPPYSAPKSISEPLPPSKASMGAQQPTSATSRPIPIIKPSPPPPSPEPIPKEESYDIRKEELDANANAKKRKKIPPEKFPEVRTVHTHIHYYSRMNPRKTYPFTVTLSSIAKKIRRDQTSFLTGEKETETRGEFELERITKQIMVEPLLSGCLVQPTFQFVDPREQNLPKELTFYVTPLVEPGFQPVHLKGTLFIKDELGAILYQMGLPELSVTSSRISQVLAIFGTILGGAMPVADSLFGTGLQDALVAQLAIYLGSIAESVDLWSIVLGIQAIIFTICVGGGFLYWWIKGRAKAAPERAMTLHLPH